MSAALAWVLGLLATASPSPVPTPVPAPPDELVDPGRGGWIAVGMIVFLVVAVVVLYRSMRTQMSRVSDDLPRSDDATSLDEPPADPSVR